MGCDPRSHGDRLRAHDASAEARDCDQLPGARACAVSVTHRAPNDVKPFAPVASTHVGVCLAVFSHSGVLLLVSVFIASLLTAERARSGWETSLR